MHRITLSQDVVFSGEIIAEDVPYVDFLAEFDGQSVEWIDGTVIAMSPVTSDHNALSVFFITLFETYLSLTGGGYVLHDPMVMRPAPDLPARSPDIQIILPENAHIIQKQEVNGAPDLVIEIVSPSSHRRDRVEKFGEYEKAGIKEYWILDSVRKESLFYQLGADGLYVPVTPDETGYYQSKVLPRFRILVTIFFQIPLPRGKKIVDLVEAMLEGSDSN